MLQPTGSKYFSSGGSKSSFFFIRDYFLLKRLMTLLE
jgi:hypothetical protein